MAGKGKTFSQCSPHNLSRSFGLRRAIQSRLDSVVKDRNLIMIANKFLGSVKFEIRKRDAALFREVAGCTPCTERANRVEIELCAYNCTTKTRSEGRTEVVFFLHCNYDSARVERGQHAGLGLSHNLHPAEARYPLTLGRLTCLDLAHH